MIKLIGASNRSASSILVAVGLLVGSLAAAGNAAAENSLTDRLVVGQQTHSRPASDDAALAFQVTMGEAIKRSGIASAVATAEVNDEGIRLVGPTGGETAK
jgi:hypothetical protein